MAAFDAVLSSSAQGFLQSLSISERVEFLLVLDDLLNDPHPDGVSTVELDFFPYDEGTVGATRGEFWITINSSTRRRSV